MVVRLFFIFLFLTSCQDGKNFSGIKKRNQKADYLYRTSYEYTAIPPKISVERERYPWEEKFCGALPKITKEYFRCKGSSLNPPRTEEVKGELVRLADCGGIQKHSLPLRNGKEFVYPILIDLLNYVQEKTQKKIVITSGHRCPDHNIYGSPDTPYSKHMIGAEVDFYVQGMEMEPGLVIKHLIDYYKDDPNPQLREFKRYEKESNASIQPWFNKEIFIKLFAKGEGRDFDNNHAYPYIAIQVRYDREAEAPVAYSWPQAWKNYLRY